MRFAVMIEGQEDVSWDDWVALARACERLGFEALFRSDHYGSVEGVESRGSLDAWATVCALAAITSELRLGTLVSPATFRHPSVLAKNAVTADHISGGRIELGIGTGWNEREHDAYGLTLHSPGDRVQLLDEALTVIRSLLTERRTTFEGRFYHFHDAPFSPKPVQAKLPIMIGGKRPKMLRVVAKHADLWDAGGTVDDVRSRNAEFAAACAEVGRDPHEVVRSVSLGADRLEDPSGFADLIRAYRAAGASQFLFDFPITAKGQEAAARIAGEIMPGLRAEDEAARGQGGE
jgi:probable F420-dependent oxidoreductase